MLLKANPEKCTTIGMAFLSEPRTASRLNKLWAEHGRTWQNMAELAKYLRLEF
jgi:hypothetical protein